MFVDVYKMEDDLSYLGKVLSYLGKVFQISMQWDAIQRKCSNDSFKVSILNNPAWNFDWESNNGVTQGVWKVVHWEGLTLFWFFLVNELLEKVKKVYLEDDTQKEYKTFLPYNIEFLFFPPSHSFHYFHG
jgi:hypothetical protein